MRVARELGAFNTLIPPGIESLSDVPHPLFSAIRNALLYLSFDELPDDERPPKRIWEDAKRLDAWFKEVRRKRERQYSDKQIEDPVQNQAAQMLIVGDD